MPPAETVVTVVSIIHKTDLPSPDEVPPSLRAAAVAALAMPLRVSGLGDSVEVVATTAHDRLCPIFFPARVICSFSLSEERALISAS